MTLFRNVLVWLLLAVLGALLAQFLMQDAGYVLVRYRGNAYQTTVAQGIGLLLALVFALALLSMLVRLPFRAWRRRRARREHAQLVEGLAAFERGDYARAGQRLREAMAGGEAQALARAQAARAALARGQVDAGIALVEGFGDHDAAWRALVLAEHALAQHRFGDALAALEAPSAQPLPPRALLLRARALAANGRAGEAYGLLGALRRQEALAATELDELQTQWAAQALREAPDPSALADQWDALATGLRQVPEVATAYAVRAAALGWNDAAGRSLEQALDECWDDALAALYGDLDIAQLAHRQAHVERWLADHPSSPGLLFASARLAQQQGRWLPADAMLRQAIAHGADARAWEALGAGAAALGDEPRARQCYANALRLQRGDAPLDVADDGGPQRPADAPLEERDQHGLPRLPG